MIKLVLLAKAKFISIEVLLSKALIDSNISHDQFFLLNSAERIFAYVKRNQKFQ